MADTSGVSVGPTKFLIASPQSMSVEDLLEGHALDRPQIEAQRCGDRGRHVAAPDRGKPDAALDVGAGGEEERRVVRVDRALAVGAGELRRTVLVVAGGIVAEGVAGRRLEHHVGHLTMILGCRKAERCVLSRWPHPTHTFHRFDLAGEPGHGADVTVEAVERSGAVVHHEARLAGDLSLLDAEGAEPAKANVGSDLARRW